MPAWGLQLLFRPRPTRSSPLPLRERVVRAEGEDRVRGVGEITKNPSPRAHPPVVGARPPPPPGEGRGFPRVLHVRNETSPAVARAGRRLIRPADLHGNPRHFGLPVPGPARA